MSDNKLQAEYEKMYWNLRRTTKNLKMPKLTFLKAKEPKSEEFLEDFLPIKNITIVLSDNAMFSDCNNKPMAVYCIKKR